jgi:GT2 family glycosyltransferase
MHLKVSILMAVHNGAPWLADVLDSVSSQDYPNLELTVCDNASTDATRDIISRYPNARLVSHGGNNGFWYAMERLIAESDAPYVVCLTDVVLTPRFVSEAVAALERDPAIGAVQGKIYQQRRRADGSWERTGRIDALGFRLQKSRRTTILGVGEEDEGHDNSVKDIFGVEGAVPVFRRAALDDCMVDGFRVTDPAFRVGGITYADDLDLAWRMTLFGWRQVLVPTAIGWHDRSTNKGTAHVPVVGQLSRLTERRGIDIQKRRLDWSNVRFSIIKNDSIINILKHLPRIAVREIAVAGYTALFEPGVFREAGRFFRLLPLMLKRRRTVQARARLSAAQMRRFIR